MQTPFMQRVMDWFYSLGGWEEKRSGVVGPDERLPWGQTTTMGLQHVLAMFGATVIAPILMGFDPNLAIFFSGIGTLLFFAITAGRVPSYLGSSFAFIAPAGAVMAGGGGVKEILGGIVAAGLIYTAIGFAVQYLGSDWIDALMPPLVTGTIVAIIGLNLAGAARDMAESNMFLAAITIAAILAIALYTGGAIGRLPVLLGTVLGYLVALILGGTSAFGREVGPLHVQGVDFEGIEAASWFGLPEFITPSFSWNAISLVAPVAIVLVAENTGHIKAISVMTRSNLMPWLGRGFIGDGVATTVAGLGGGTGVTTYAENIGVMAVTRVYSTAMFVVAGFMAILLGLSPKFGAVIASIPIGVLGGVATVLFGLIAVTGFRIWTDNNVDFSNSANLFIVAVTIIVGAADYTVHIGDFAMGGIALGTFGIIILHQIFGGDGYSPPAPPSGSGGGGRTRQVQPQRQDTRPPQQRPQRPAAGYDRSRDPRSEQSQQRPDYPPQRQPQRDPRPPARGERPRRPSLDDLPDFPDDELRPRR